MRFGFGLFFQRLCLRLFLFFFFAPLFLTFQPFFIKNRFYGTIHTFKNYFTTIFSVFNFNKLFCLLIFEKTFLSLNYCGKVLFSLYIYIYIYIYIHIEISSSYTWCNFIRVTHFLDDRFSLDLTVINYHLLSH